MSLKVRLPICIHARWLAPHRLPMWGLFLSVSPLRHKAKRLARGYIAAHNVAARVDPERAGGCRSGEVDGDVVSVHGLDKTVEPGRVVLYAGDLASGIHVVSPCRDSRKPWAFTAGSLAPR